MNSLNVVLLLLVAYVAVFLQSTCQSIRAVLGAQIDLLPGLMVYAALSSGLVAVGLLAVCGGLWFDALSANPLGVSVLPLIVIGIVIERYRGLILREQSYAQFLLGLMASAGAPVMTVLLLLNRERELLLGWKSVWQLAVMALGGALLTPVWFRLLGWASAQLSYASGNDPSRVGSREMKRGRV